MHMDAPLTTFTKNDGIKSLLHCQEGNYMQNFDVKSLHTLQRVARDTI